MVYFVLSWLEKGFLDKKIFDEWIICIDKFFIFGYLLI